MHQQLYLLGRDIESRHGNILVQYGAKKTCAPDGCAVSLYTFHLPGGYRLALRGFGVFIGSDRLGGLFMQRYRVEPQWMPSARFQPVAWIPKDLPRTRKVRRSEYVAASQLVNKVCRFFSSYEQWVREEYGVRYRIGCLVTFRRMGNDNIHWHTPNAWGDLC
jgi:hypothetical protein